MGEHYNMLCFTWFRLLFIIVTTPVLSYSKFECPSRTEWKFRAVSNCNIPEGYHCLFNENTNEFGEFCDTRSYNDPAGHKLVLVGDLDRRDCEGTRYQPFSFSTNGMSSCIFEKTYCREEGQVIHTEGTADSDRQCRCDYTRSYAFIIKPKQSCYCVPSKEDCSCYKKPCPLGFIMTPDYECINKTVWTGKFSCALIHSNGDTDSKQTTSFIPNSKETESKAYNSSNEYKTVFTVLVVAAILSAIAFMMSALFLDRSPSGSINGHIQFENIMRENLELKNRLDNPIPENIKELQNYEKKQWKERLHRFVETKPSKIILESMKKEQCILVTGPPGCGKSSLAFYIALTLEETEGFELLIVTNPDDIVRYASKDKKQIFIIEDIFGKYSVHNYDTMWWSKQCHLVLTLLDRNKDFKILATCRSYIFNSVDIVTVNNAFVHHSLIEKDMEITESNRREIGKSYLSDAIIDQLGKDVIMKYSFFPALCGDFSSNTKENVVDYFSTPYNYVASEIGKRNKSKDLDCFSLALLVILNSNIRKDMLTQDTSIYNELIQSLANEIGYTQTPSKLSLLVCLNALIGSYVIETGSEFSFMNETLFYIIAHVLSKHILRTLLKYGRISFLKDRVKFLSMDGHFPKLTIMIPDTLESAYFDRILCNIKMGLFFDVLTDTHNYFSKFREAFIMYMKPKLKWCDLKDSDDGSTVLHAVSLHGYEDYLIYFIEVDKSLVNKGNSSGQIPLHLACVKGHSRTAKLLIEKRTFIDKTDNNENTPLDLACANGHKDTVDVLLFHKAIIKQKPISQKTALHVVCRNGNTIITTMLLKRNANVNVRDKAGHTPLHLASMKGHVEISELLIQNNADVNLADYKVRTAIYLACEQKKASIVELLLKSNANTYIDNDDGKRPIHCSCEGGCLEIVELLLSHNVEINQRDTNESTPLHWACRKGNELIVKLLLEKNADVSPHNKNRDTPLHIACNNGNVKIIKMLLDYKAIVNCKNKYHKTPLHLACEHGLQDGVSLLLEKNANVNAKDKEANTPLHFACLGGYEKIVEALCMHDVSVDETNKYGMTSLHICCEKGNPNVIAILLQHGADINKTDDESLTPLYIACRDNKIDIIRLLLSLGSNVNITDKDECSPLYLACKDENIEMTKTLLKWGANVNQAAKDGIAPLHLTAQAGNTDLTKLLIESKASVNMVEKLGQTPLFKSLSSVHKDVTELLLQNGASVNISDKFNMTPIRFALQKKDNEIINLLQHYNME